jgi:DNA-binding PucR family transcriptional regulator
VIVRGTEQFAEERTEQTLPARIALRRIVETARAHLRADGNPALVGMRHGEVVALCPVGERADLEDVSSRAGALAGTLGDDRVAIGIGGFHPTLAGVARSYVEARDAADIAGGIGLQGRPLSFDEVLIDHMLRLSPYADRILDSAMEALIDYDAVRQAELVSTLRAFIANGFCAARAGEALCVHPNTVAYRIRRIRELSGRDPQSPDDLLFFLLGLKLLDMRSAE